MIFPIQYMNNKWIKQTAILLYEITFRKREGGGVRINLQSVCTKARAQSDWILSPQEDKKSFSSQLVIEVCVRTQRIFFFSLIYLFCTQWEIHAFHHIIPILRHMEKSDFLERFWNHIILWFLLIQ